MFDRLHKCFSGARRPRSSLKTQMSILNLKPRQVIALRLFIIKIGRQIKDHLVPR